MIRLKRLEEITKLLETQGSVEVSSLSKHFDVTEKTIRQDLTRLEEISVATRIHGGAVINNKNSDVFPLLARKQSNLPEKEQIARRALELIEDGDAIILDAGTTTQQLALILDKWVTVITNDPLIVDHLKDKENITLFVTGGLLKRTRGSSVLIGQDALRMLKGYHVNKYFLGVSAIDFEKGCMLFTTDEIDVKQTMMRAANEIICLADYSKFHKTALISFAQLEELDAIVTTDAIAQEDIEILHNKGIRVIIS